MSPIDDELRRVLALHADEAALQTDPLAGIEREAKMIRRRRTGTAVLGAVMSVALVALAVPAIRGSLEADTREGRVAGTPTPDASTEAIPQPSRKPLNALPWHRSVVRADYDAALKVWAGQFGYGDIAEGQALWEGPAAGISGRVIVLQAWTSDGGFGKDAHTVTALVGGPYVDTVIVGDEVSYVSERTTHVTASYVLADHTAKTVLVVRPDVAAAVVDGTRVDVSSGGAIVDRRSTPRTVRVVLTDDKGAQVADHHDQPAAGSVLADSPLRWKPAFQAFESRATSDQEMPGIDQQASDAMRSSTPGVAEIAVLNSVFGSSTSGSVTLIVGEYADHGWSVTDSAYVAGFYLVEKGKAARLIGLHDLPVGVTSISGVIPASFYEGKEHVFFTPSTGWHARYVGGDTTGWVSIGFDPVGTGAQEVESTPIKSEGDPILRDTVGQGLSFPDI